MHHILIPPQYPLSFIILLTLTLGACDDSKDGTSNDGAMMAGMTVEAGDSGETSAVETAGETTGETAGTDMAGAQVAGETAGTEAAGEITAGIEVAGETTAGEVTAGDTSSQMGCDIEGLTPANTSINSDGMNITYSAISAADAPYNAIQISSLANWGGPTTPGTYSLDGINYADCGLCLLASVNCTEDGCEKTLYAEEGSVEIEEIGFAVGERFVGRLDGVVFREVTIEDGTFVSTQVEGGDTWCLDGFEFDQEIVDPTAEACSRDGVTCVGNPIADYELMSCATGEMVSAHSLMDQLEKGLWMVLTASWCTACREYIPQVRASESMLAMDGVNVIYVLGEDNNFERPDLSECQRYAESYGEDALDRFYIDFGDEFGSFEATFTSMWPYLGPNGEFGLPWNALTRSGMYNYEYVYGDGAPGLNLEAGIQSLLAP